MPTYHYRCACGNEMKRVYPIGRSKKTLRCRCGETAEKAITVPTVFFRGPGFSRSGSYYETDV